MWAPSDGVLEKVAFPRIRTLDSSASPVREDRIGKRGSLATLCVPDIKATLARLVEFETD